MQTLLNQTFCHRCEQSGRELALSGEIRVEKQLMPYGLCHDCADLTGFFTQEATQARETLRERAQRHFNQRSKENDLFNTKKREQ